MNEKWSEKTTVQKTMDIISGIAFVVWLLFEILERTNKVKSAGLVTCIAIIVVCVCEAISFWKVKRSLSYVAIAGAVILLAVVILAAIYDVQL